MNGSIPRKLGRLVSNLIVNPHYLSRCFKHNIVNGTSPLDLAVPWFSYAANEFLAKYLRPHMLVCEYGAGGSTLFYARHARFVYSIEDRTLWFERVSARMEELGISNVELMLRPFDFKNPIGFERSDYLLSMPDEQFDVISIDGSEEWTQVRPICFAHAEKHIKPGGIIVLDDSWRYPGLRTNNRAKRFRIFQSVGPCRPGVTSTDIFFY